MFNNLFKKIDDSDFSDPEKDTLYVALDLLYKEMKTKDGLNKLKANYTNLVCRNVMKCVDEDYDIQRNYFEK